MDDHYHPVALEENINTYIQLSMLDASSSHQSIMIDTSHH